MSLPLVKYILTAAMRDKIALTLFLLIGVAASLSVFLGDSALNEQDSFALVFGASGLRFVTVIGVTLFVAFYMRRSFETREVEFLLARPLSRPVFLASHATAFIVLSVFASVMMIFAVSLLGKPDTGGLLMWGFSVIVENMIVACLSMFFSVVLSSAAGSALATLGFYALARLIGVLLVLAAQPAGKISYQIMNNLLEVISVVVPRLDLMGQTSWLVYGVAGSGGFAFMNHAGRFAHQLSDLLGVGGFIAVQGVFCLLLVYAAASFDFIRRQF